MNAIQTALNDYATAIVSFLWSFTLSTSEQVCTSGIAVSYIIWACTKDRSSGVWCFKFFMFFLLINILGAAVR